MHRISDKPDKNQRRSGDDPFLVVLTGNPNCGKTTLFNALTGLRARVGNYAGVTVERKEGAMQGALQGAPVSILDLPGTYSLSPQSLDERIARDVLLQRLPEVGEPDLVVLVVDASNLQRNLYYATQVIELGYPVFVALNMMDVARENGHELDVEGLSAALRVPVFALVASDGEGVAELKAAIQRCASEGVARKGQSLDLEGGNPGRQTEQFLELPESFGKEVNLISGQLVRLFPERLRFASAEAVLLLSDDAGHSVAQEFYPAPVIAAVGEAHRRLEEAGIDWRSAAIESRYARASAIQAAVTTDSGEMRETFSDKLDRILTDRFWGIAIFVGIMALMFESIFAFAKLPMDAIKDGVDSLAAVVGRGLGPGDLNSLLANGVIKGVGSVLVFLPQICLLFLFISLLEDTGYMARAAFLMDRLMSRVGLHGKSFIPMLSSFACAIPGVMATRTIESPKDRLVTILVAPLMSCSARLPVYTVLIAACIPDIRVLGVVGLPGLVMLGMYLLGIAGAFAMAWLFKKTLLRGEIPPLILELPPYKRPVISVVLRHMWDRSKLFLRRAGTVILGINVILWFLATYPRHDELKAKFDAERARAAAASETTPAAIPGDRAAEMTERLNAIASQEAGEHLRQSYVGILGQFIEPIIQPLGFDWRIGVGIVASFAAREIFVSTMSVVYNVGNRAGDDTPATSSLAEVMQHELRSNGTRLYTPLTGVTLMVFYVFAMQCVSTVAVVRRETGGWKWPLFQWAYMTSLAWTLAFVVYQGGLAVGWQ
jgi:ferrous iron transport protein B